MINSAMFSSSTDLWATPIDFFRELDSEFRFTLDPCCTHENAKCKKHYTLEEDGLAQSWRNEVVFCNPPYGRELPKWVKKCHGESRHATVVMLIPARTDTRAFHDYIYGQAEIRFIKGRLKFGNAKNSAPFPSMVVVFKNKEAVTAGWDRRNNTADAYLELIEEEAQNGHWNDIEGIVESWRKAKGEE